MLARYGIRGVLDMTKPWRLVVFCAFSLVALVGGFRSTFVVFVMVLALLFYLERLHHTRLLLPAIFVLLAGGGLLILFAPQLPLPIQRSISVLPFVRIDPLVRLNAESSSEWRLEMWREVVPQIPKYLLVGKGYAFSGTEQQQLQLRDSMESTELVGDYHNGPLSVILPFGIFGSIAFVWLMAAAIRVFYQNYQFGDPAYHHINIFLFAYFVVKVIFFLAVFGSFYSDLPLFLGLLGLSISLNGGVAKPVVVPEPKIVFNRFKLHPSRVSS
jgi:O-antigen ligase